MKVRLCKTIDIDTEIDVDLGDMFNEFWSRLEEGGEDQGQRYTVCPLLDTMTRLIAKISDKSISEMRPDARAEVAKRLEAQLKRFA